MSLIAIVFTLLVIGVLIAVLRKFDLVDQGMVNIAYGVIVLILVFVALKYLGLWPHMQDVRL
jgi:hypothetical protein